MTVSLAAPRAKKAPKTYDIECHGCHKMYLAKRSTGKYCESCRDAGNTGPRVRTKLNTSLRIMKGVKLNINLPLFKF